LAIGSVVGLLLQRRAVSAWRMGLNIGVLVAGVAATTLWLYSRDRTVQGTSTPPPTYAGTLRKVAEGSFATQIVKPIGHVYDGGPALAQLFTGQRMPPFLALAAIGLPVGVGAYMLCGKQRSIALCAAGGYLGAILLVQAPLTRYYLPVSAVLLLCLVYGIRRIANSWGPSPRFASNFTVVIMVLVMAFNLPKDLRQIYRLHGARADASPRYLDMVAAADYLQQHDSVGAKFVMEKHANIVAYLSGMDCLRIEKHCAEQSIPGRASAICFWQKGSAM
jgi:hypothetical protein